MKFSWDWLQEHIKLDIPASEAAEMLSLRGLTVDEIIEIDGDIVFDIDITTNRPDAMNVRGIARELSAITGIDLESVPVNFHEQTKRVHELASVDIEEPELCHRFCARAITSIKNGPSPDWMRKRLEAVGMRSLNLLVDITNYVLWELGHPLHGYDLNLVPGGKLIVRRARKGEKLRLLDGTDRTLDENILVIADKEHAVGIGGVMGGEETELNDKTTSVLLECAWFDPVSTRKTARALGLNTEASYRFERGMDHDDIPRVLDRACHLYQQLAGGEICKEMIDEYPTSPAPCTVTMYHEKLCGFAGLEISKDKVAQVLSALDFSATFKESFWKVEVPSRRVDVTRAADLYEEVIRIIGFDQIPPTLPHVEQVSLEPDPLHVLIDAAESALTGAGFDEVINYDFIDPADNAVFAPEDAGDPIEVLNPIATPQMSTMRQSLAPSLMMNLRHNANRGNKALRIFEIARVFFHTAEGPLERTKVAFAMDAAQPEPFWRNQGESADFFDLKGVIEYLFTRIGLFDIIFCQGARHFLHPEERSDMYISDAKKQQPIGWFGRVTGDVLKHFDLDYPVYLGQIELEAALGRAQRDVSFSRPSIYPSVSRDISFAVPESGEGITYETILDTIRNIGVESLVDVRLIDRYSGEQTGGGQSMTVRLTYQRNDRTLIQEEVDSLHAKITDALAGLGATLR